MALEDRLIHTLRRDALLPEGGVLVVAVSGGADSLALLHMLKGWGESLRCTLHAATFDHGLRGVESAADAQFVVDLCRQWDVPCTMGRADIENLPQTRIEAWAREARYRFLAQVAADVGASHIATAHHLNDQAETVLMRLLRGAGLAGLGAMAIKSPLPYAPHLTLIRPLLNITRAEIEAYAREHDLHPREDSTNEDVTFARNHIRHEVLPVLRRVNPQVDRVLAQFAEIARVDDDYMEGQLQQLVLPRVTMSAHHVSLERAVFNTLPLALARRFVAWAAAQISDEDGDTGGFVHIVAAVRVAQTGQVGAVAQLPGGLQLRVDYGAVVIEQADVSRIDPELRLLPVGVALSVAVPGVTLTPDGWTLRVALTPDELDFVRGRLVLPEAGEVILRTRQTGDRIAPPGLKGHTKKLTDWMIDRKISRSVRDRLPLLVVNGEIAAVLVTDRWVISDRFVAERANGIHVYLE